MFEFVGWFLFCFVIADFLTGLAHWAEDTYCLDGYPLVGKLICEPNIDHHVDPTLMVKTGTFVSRNKLQWLACLGAFLFLWFLGLGGITAFTVLLIASFGNEVHRWNHTNDVNKFAAFIKDSGLIQSRRQHSLHHRPPNTSYYCVLGSLTNSVLEFFDFWRKLEWALKSVFGLTPKREGRRDQR
jgi:ubiquitin-conjugating enzyme E2 variant